MFRTETTFCKFSHLFFEDNLPLEKDHDANDEVAASRLFQSSVGCDCMASGDTQDVPAHLGTTIRELDVDVTVGFPLNRLPNTHAAAAKELLWTTTTNLADGARGRKTILGDLIAVLAATKRQTNGAQSRVHVSLELVDATSTNPHRQFIGASATPSLIMIADGIQVSMCHSPLFNSLAAAIISRNIADTFACARFNIQSQG